MDLSPKKIEFSSSRISVPSNLTCFSLAPNTTVSQVKIPGMPYKEASRYFTGALDERVYGLEDIPQLMSTIKILQEKAEKLFEHEYNGKKSSIVELANNHLQNEVLSLESKYSSFYPVLSYQDIEDLELID